jgi:Fic family protein
VAAGSYWSFVPNELPAAMVWTLELVTALSEADRSLGELSGLGRVLPNPHLLIGPFMRREAVLSSQIEGTQASLFDLYAFEATQLPLFGPLGDVREVHNYVEALEYGLDRLRSLPLSLRLIREVHERLMTGVRGEHRAPGEFRRSQNWIGPPGCVLNDATYVPPPPTEMSAALSALEKFLHAESSLPPLVRLGMIHYQFEAIHPFLDGNGRIGRLLLPLLLCAWDLLQQPLLYLSAYFEAHRQEYYDRLLAVSQRGEWEAWLRFFLTGVAEQACDAVERASQLQTLREEYRSLAQSSRAPSYTLQIVDLLFARPVVTISQVADTIHASFPSAMRHLASLERQGIVREITGKARNRVYQADAILRAIGGRLSDDGRSGK